MDKQSKGLFGKLTVWYTMTIAVAALRGAAILGSISGLLVIKDHEIELDAASIWLIIITMLFQIAAFALPVMSAKGIYGRRMRGYYLAYASAAAFAAYFVFSLVVLPAILIITKVSWFDISCNVILYGIVIVLAREGEQYLLSREELDKNESISDEEPDE